jgi:hypothetical protein
MQPTNSIEPSIIKRKHYYAQETLRDDTAILTETNKRLKELSSTVKEATRSLEDLYLTPLERARLLASMTGLGAVALGMATGMPAILGVPRIAFNIANIIKSGRRIRATREAYVGLYDLLSEFTWYTY